MNNELTLTGQITEIGAEQKVSEKFTKREFVIMQEGDYGTPARFELTNSKTSLIDKFRVNDKVTVSFNVRGNEHKGVVYVSLQAWKIV